MAMLFTMPSSVIGLRISGSSTLASAPRTSDSVSCGMPGILGVLDSRQLRGLGCDPVGVGVLPCHDVRDVGHRVVVAQDGAALLGQIAHVQIAVAEVFAGGQGGVVEGLRVGDAVAVAVGGEALPGL